jgi:hypothetical protein
VGAKVFIFESLKPTEPHEGETLSHVLNLAEIPNRYFSPCDEGELLECLNEVVNDRVEELVAYRKEFHSGGNPVAFARYLHFSCHGNEAGLALRRGDLDWLKFKGHLIAMAEKAALMVDNQACIGLMLSTCLGANSKEVLFGAAPFPCVGSVAPTREVFWVDAVVAFSVFITEFFIAAQSKS